MSKQFTSIGLDLSCTATGVVVLQASGVKVPHCTLNKEIVPKKLAGMARVVWIATEVMTLVHDYKPDRICMEGYSLNMKNASSVVPLVEVGGAIRLMMFLDGLQWLDPRAGQVKEFSTGKGNSAKDLVIMNVYKRWGFEAATNNIADAYVCAAMGLAHVNKLPGITERMRAIAGELKLNTA